MAETERYSGKDLYLSFGGTDLSADFTSVTINEEDDEIDLTAGNDTEHYYKSLRSDATVDYECFWNGGTAQTEFDAVVPGTAGTLLIGPRGTASGYPKITVNRALAKSRRLTMPFDRESKLTGTFQCSATVTRGTW